jgi:hypothetical protein
MRSAIILRKRAGSGVALFRFATNGNPYQGSTFLSDRIGAFLLWLVVFLVPALLLVLLGAGDAGPLPLGVGVMGLYSLQRDPRPAVVPVEGQRVTSRLINNVTSHFVTLVARATFTIAGGAATAIRNRGSVWSIFDKVGIDADGEDIQVLPGNVLRFLSEMAAPSALTANRVTSTAAAAYTLEEAARIYFAHPFAAVPRETSFRERDKNVELRAFFETAPGAFGGAAAVDSRLADVAGAVSGALTAPTVQVTQGYDKLEQARPYLIPRVRQILSEDIAGANPTREFFIKTTRYLRQLIILQECATSGEVGDIINSLAIKSDSLTPDIIGPSRMDIDDLMLESEFEFGGAVVASNRSLLGFNFQTQGMLSKLLAPYQALNLRIEASVQPSVTGTGTSRVRIFVVELEPMAGVTEDKLPFAI